ncbi:hypothetical protein G7084_03445 [Weissella coleopterorum]|uniref:Uncharacterized protein n=1 Tax=Weissella coleopterorum TaxID=2714949 RepID=A0A6G8AZG3_9LACO|nr:hypothetical protein [Weissella coleopterorum]QIL50454.1 hypothetical protein G7084_03445 [Weissella coleopterorum]
MIHNEIQSAIQSVALIQVVTQVETQVVIRPQNQVGIRLVILIVHQRQSRHQRVTHTGIQVVIQVVIQVH